MPDVALSALEPRWQTQLETARLALERDNPGYTIELCAEVLARAPGCLPVRQLLRAAQLRQFPARSHFAAKALGAVMALAVRLRFGNGKKDPVRMMAAADRMLARNPASVPALKLLARAATGRDFPQTAVFACECVRALAPADADNLRALGEACLAAGRPQEAVRAANESLKLQPLDGGALALLRQASVAQTIAEGNWAAPDGTFRDKLRASAPRPDG